MAYSIRWHEKAAADLKKADKKSARGIVGRISEYLPQRMESAGKPLKGIFKGLYRYRFGDFRIIYGIDHDKKEILILRIGMRKDVYR